MAPRKRLATYADIEALPEHKVSEIVDGELFVSPRPATHLALAKAGVGGLLIAKFGFADGGPGGWWMLFEPEVHLEGNVVVPDLAGWRRDRLPTIPDEAYFVLAPDFVCELVSPTTGRLDRARKVPLYARQGVEFVWLVDADQRTVEVLHLVDGHYQIVQVSSEDQIMRAPPFEVADLPLSRLWVPTRAT